MSAASKGKRWRGGRTVVGDALEGLLEELAPVQVEAVQPGGDAALLEGRGVLVGVLLLHLGEARDGEVREVLAVGGGALLGLVVGGHGGWSAVATGLAMVVRDHGSRFGRFDVVKEGMLIKPPPNSIASTATGASAITT